VSKLLTNNAILTYLK